MGCMIRSANTSGSGSAEPPQQRQAQPVYPDIVIFPVRTRGAAARADRPCGPSLPAARLRLRSITSDLPNSSPSHSDVFCNRCRQVIATIVGTVETTVVHRAADRLVQIRDQPVCDRDPGQQAQVALGGREGEIDLVRLPPGRDLEAAPQHQTVGRPARPDGTQQFVERRRLEEAAFQVQTQVARPLRFVLSGEPGGFLEPHPVHAGTIRRGFRPRLAVRRRHDRRQFHPLSSFRSGQRTMAPVAGRA